MGLLLRVNTTITWIDDTASIPVLGDMLVFILVFVPAVLASFALQALVSSLNNDIGFTKAMLVILPAWNLILWFTKIRAYIFFIPSWILRGVIAIIKAYLMIKGIDNGQ